MKGTNALIIIFCAFLVMRVFTLWPESEALYDFFPFENQLITTRMHIYFISMYIQNLILLYVFSRVMDAYRFQFNLFIILESCDLLDYMLRYNERLFMFNGYSIEYEDIKLILMGLIICVTIINDKRNA